MRPSLKRVTLGITIILPLVAFYYQSTNSMSVQAVRQLNLAAGSFAGRNAVVMGGTSGIGQGIAVRLAEANYNVIIIGRDPVRGEAIVNEMKQKSTAPSGQYQFIPCDAFLLKNVKETADKIRSLQASTDVVVVTQGVGTLQGRTETSEGIDQKLSLHYFGRILFIQELLPLLRTSAQQYTTSSSASSSSASASVSLLPPRVLSVLSAGVHSPFPDYKTDFELKQTYTLKNAADSAGFYNDVMLDALSKRPENQNITFIHAAPGFVNTQWGRDMPFYIKPVLTALKYFANSIYDTAEYMLYPVFDKKYTHGLVLVDPHGKETKKTNLHDEAIDTVYQKTQEVFQRVLQ